MTRKMTGAVWCILLSFATLPPAGRPCRAGEKAEQMLAKVVDALVPDREPPSDWTGPECYVEWMKYFMAHPDAIIPPGQFEKLIRRLKGELRRLASREAPGRSSVPPAVRDEVMLHWKRNGLWALEMLSAFRDPADLPLFWANIGMYRPRLPEPGSMRWIDLSYPVAEAMCRYGDAAKAFLIERIAQGDTDRWTLKMNRRELGALHKVLGKVAGHFDILLYEEAAKRPEDERKRLLMYLQKLYWGLPLEKILPRIEKRIRERKAVKTTPAAKEKDGSARPQRK